MNGLFDDRGKDWSKSKDEKMEGINQDSLNKLKKREPEGVIWQYDMNYIFN